MADSYKIYESKKYLWDGKEYASDAEAKGVEENYRKDKFETKLLTENGKFLVYTRRVATAEAAPPQ